MGLSNLTANNRWHPDTNIMNRWRPLTFPFMFGWENTKQVWTVSRSTRTACDSGMMSRVWCATVQFVFRTRSCRAACENAIPVAPRHARGLLKLFEIKYSFSKNIYRLR